MQPIHLAALGGHVDIINTLVTEHGVDPNSKVSYVCFHLRSYSYHINNSHLRTNYILYIAKYVHTLLQSYGV